MRQQKQAVLKCCTNLSKLKKGWCHFETNINGTCGKHETGNIKYYYKNENDAKKDYKNKESDLLKTSFNSNLEISKNVITQNITDLFKDMSKSEVKNNILSGYQE